MTAAEITALRAVELKALHSAELAKPREKQDESLFVRLANAWYYEIYPGKHGFTHITSSTDR